MSSINNDAAIIYNGKLISVKASLEKLKELDFDIEKLEEAIHTIEEETETKISESYSSFDSDDSKSFLHDSVGSSYRSAIKKIEKIENLVEEEYYSYSKINSKYKYLKGLLKDFNGENVDELVQRGISLLDSIKCSSHVDYHMEKALVENIYGLIYQILKVEVIFGKINLLEKIKDDETDSSYISTLINQNIQELEDNKKDAIYKLISKLDADDQDENNLISYSVLKTIVEAEDKDIIIDKDFNHSIEEYIKADAECDRATRYYSELEEKVKVATITKKKNHLLLFKKRCFRFINVTLIAGGLLTSGYVLRKHMTEKNYKLNTITYDSSTDEIVESSDDYVKSKDSEVIITEYTPWVSPGYFREGYTREKYTYKLTDSSVLFENPRDYLNKDMKGFLDVTDDKNKSIIQESKTEEQEELPEDFGYTDNKYIVNKNVIDKNDYVEVPSMWKFLLTYIPSAVGIIIVDALASHFLSREKLSTRKERYTSSKNQLKEKMLLF